MSTWIFLRGLTRESRHWGDFPAAFCAEMPDADVLALDLPGNGAFCHLRSPADVAEMVAHCRRELRARGAAPPYRLLALSLGAMVALSWCERHADEVAGCVLINTSLRSCSPFYRRLRPARYPALLALPLRSDRAAESAILRMTSARAPRHRHVIDDWVAWRRERRVTAGNALRQLLAAALFRAPAARPRTELLVLAGARDALVDPACSREIARRWRTAFAEHPEAGHDLALDDGPWIAAQVRRWLQKADVMPA